MSLRRTIRRRASMLAAVGLVAGLLAITVSTSAFAAGHTGCLVTNTTLGIAYNGANGNGTTGSGLQAAIAAAGPGDTLTVSGTCVGSFTIGNVSLTLGGGPSVTSRLLDGGYRAGHWVTSLPLGGVLGVTSRPAGGGYRAGHWVP